MDSGSAMTAGGQAEHRRILVLLLFCFSQSGFAALLYQNAWLRRFSAVFRTSEPALVAELVAYMGGLAAGAALAARCLMQAPRPALLCGLLEGGIAPAALAALWMLAGARLLCGSWLGNLMNSPFDRLLRRVLAAIDYLTPP